LQEIERGEKRKVVRKRRGGDRIGEKNKQPLKDYEIGKKTQKRSQKGRGRKTRKTREGKVTRSKSNGERAWNGEQRFVKI